MHADTPKAKQSLREGIKARLAAAAPADLKRWSAGACARILASDALGAASSVMLYAPIRGELDISEVARAALAGGKHLCYPRMDWAARRFQPVRVADPSCDLIPGRYGIPEPRAEAAAYPTDKLDLILVPGLAFDLRGHRLGRGAGFYDRFLADPALAAATCGVCFELQIVGSVPVEDWDIPLNFIATEDRWIGVS